MDNLIKKKEGKVICELINDDLASKANLTWCGSDSEGNDEYIGTDKEWTKYVELEEQLEENNGD